MKLQTVAVAMVCAAITGCVDMAEIAKREREEYLRSPAYKCEQMGGIPYERITEHGRKYYGGCDFPRDSK
jgi:hypothetical protein